MTRSRQKEAIEYCVRSPTELAFHIRSPFAFNRELNTSSPSTLFNKSAVIEKGSIVNSARGEMLTRTKSPLDDIASGS